MTTAHHGLIKLEEQSVKEAILAGRYLCAALQNQPDIKKGFCLRFDQTLKPIIDIETNLTPLCFIAKKEPEQLYFMIGYPAAYLGFLYKKIKDLIFLEGAKVYLNFALDCNENIYHCKFSHKIA